VAIERSINAETSPNGLNNLTGLPSSDGTVSLSPESVKQADATVLSQSSHAALDTYVNFPVMPSHAGI